MRSRETAVSLDTSSSIKLTPSASPPFAQVRVLQRVKHYAAQLTCIVFWDEFGSRVRSASFLDCRV